MSKARQQAETAAAELLGLIRSGQGAIDTDSVADFIEQAIHNVVSELGRRALQRVGEVQASAHAHFRRLLNASPAVIYCRTATGDFNPTFVSDGVARLFGCTPQEYLANPYLWRDRVHPDDVAPINEWVDRIFSRDRRTSIEYRVRRSDGSYFWLHDRQHVIRDEAGAPLDAGATLDRLTPLN